MDRSSLSDGKISEIGAGHHIFRIPAGAKVIDGRGKCTFCLDLLIRIHTWAFMRGQGVDAQLRWK